MNCVELYSLISRHSERGYALTDHIFGLPYILDSDIQDDGRGRFVVKFRIPIEEGMTGIESVTDNVCRDLRCEKELYVKVESEYGIPYYNCAWIIDTMAK